MTNVWIGEVLMPPLAVPPLSCSCRLTVALPYNPAAGVKVSVPVGLTLGAVAKSVGSLLAVMMKLTVCDDSLAGPGEICVAQLLMDCGPEFCRTVGLAPMTNEGAWFTGVTEIETVAGALVFVPSLAT